MNPTSQQAGLRPIIVASHERSGTHLTMDTLRGQFKECSGWKYPMQRADHLYLNFDAVYPGSGLEQIGPGLAHKILKRAPRPLIKTHRLPPLATPDTFAKHHADLGRCLEQANTLYVYRDGRDVVCSYWLFRKVFDPRARVPLGEFLRQEDENGKTCITLWIEHVRSWLDQPGVIALKFEDLVKNTEQALAMLEDRLQLTRTHREPLLPRPWKSRLESRLRCRVFGVRPRVTTILGRSRFKDKVSWKTAFSQEDRELFNQTAGELMQSLGYDPA